MADTSFNVHPGKVRKEEDALVEVVGEKLCSELSEDGDPDAQGEGGVPHQEAVP